MHGVLLLVGVPLANALLAGGVRLAGLGALTNANLSQLLRHPLALSVVLLAVLLFALCVLSEIVFIIALAELHQRGEQVSWGGLRRLLGPRLRRLASAELLLVVPYLLVLMPLGRLGAGIGSDLTNWIRVPAFITGELAKTPVGVVIHPVVIVLLSYLNLRLIHLIPLSVTTDLGLRGCLRESLRLTRGRRLLAVLGTTVAVGLPLLLITVVVIGALLGVAAGLGALLGRAGIYPGGVIAGLIQVLMMAATGVFSVAAAHGLLSLRRAIENRPAQAPVTRARAVPLLLRARWILIGLALLVASAGNVVTLHLNQEARAPWVLAHRGDLSTGAVENTLPAVEAAVRHRPTYVEVDIQQTRDGEFAVIHDFNLGRLAGDSRRVRDLTLAELQQLPLRGPGGASGRTPSLEELLTMADRLQQPLLIELKPHGGETPDWLDRFVTALSRHDALRRHAVHSLDRTAIETLETRHPELLTGYIVPLQLGGVVGVRSDFLVLEEASFTRTVALTLQAQDRKVLVWTVNDLALMRKVTLTGADGVITDNLDQADELRGELDKDPGLLVRISDLLS
ncbi:glycerophosphodiester phosphodiesterase [Naumannella sp. ID2617S]|nr:glycerophosphodiester phosphodiesterase [Naumannella sp. ID2617S]